GVLSSIDNQIDVTTGTLKFKALFENRDQALFPNQFVNVRLLADTLKGVILAPTAALQYGTNGSFVYAMDGDKKVKIRTLKLGATDGDLTVVKEGLEPGDRVVLEGTDRLREGSLVEVVSNSSEVPTSAAGQLQGGPDADADPSAAKAQSVGKGKAGE
ncbi:MAG: MdtA/MuxA family multidrug efflux RND transporter periplasmic adaptor subunit, partial [Pseudomonas helleri]